MAETTQRRGSKDAPEETTKTITSPAGDLPEHGVIPGVRAASRRALQAALLIAFVVHLPFIPNPLATWLSVLLSLGDGEISDYEDEPTIIPIDLDLLSDDPNAASQAPSATPTGTAPPEPPAPSPPAAAPPVAEPAPVASASPREVPDAGAPDAEPTDAGKPPKPREDAGPTDKPPADDGRPKLRDPLSVAGAPGKIASKDPNVQVLIAGDRLRDHELGAWFGRVLTTIPQWQTFFAGSEVDPIRDLDHLLLAGPQFRNSSKVVAVMDYRVPEPAIRAAVDGIVQRTGGTWLPEAPLPTARARADRADRLFSLVPGKRLLVILPGDQEDQLDKLKALKPFNRSSSVGIVLSMLTPANAFKGVYKLPTSLKWLRLTVTPTKDGGADLALTAGDTSPEEAKEHADEFTRALNAVRSVDLGIMKVNVLDEVKFTADGDVIWSKIHVQSKQLKLILGFAEEAMKSQAAARNQREPEPPRRDPSTPSASTAAPTTTTAPAAPTTTPAATTAPTPTSPGATANPPGATPQKKDAPQAPSIWDD
ncbi:hypothetical protein [Chondromyces crocatus]|uniref:Uncharacterized protein n=1 Tax=Chondromyces crocatus TaxID=52 RepID=A0A0K1EHU1_CHOCO|nr:hypothetical protein [Chondromyces crocatus]AKT40424.1 uncharacterized protein CMC5_045770 [Chondromyces crocatus]